MRTWKILTAAGMAVFGVAGAVGAEEPVSLSDGQLDTVAAGQFTSSVFANGVLGGGIQTGVVCQGESSCDADGVTENLITGSNGTNFDFVLTGTDPLSGELSLTGGAAFDQLSGGAAATNTSGAAQVSALFGTQTAASGILGDGTILP